MILTYRDFLLYFIEQLPPDDLSKYVEKQYYSGNIIQVEIEAVEDNLYTITFAIANDDMLELNIGYIFYADPEFMDSRDYVVIDYTNVDSVIGSDIEFYTEGELIHNIELHSTSVRVGSVDIC